MQEELRLLLVDRVHRSALFVSIACLVLGLIFFVVRVWNLPPVVPLFYHRPWGLTQLGAPLQLLLLLAGALCIVVLNLTLAMKFYKNVVLLSRILLCIAALVCLLATTTVIRVILLVT